MKTKSVEDFCPLSPMQTEILSHALAAPGSDAGSEQFHCTLEGDLDPQAFREAWRRAAQRHAALRTGFLWQGIKEPVQIAHRRVELPWQEMDWRDVPASEQPARLDAFLAADRARGFDLTRAPLVRLAIIRLADKSWKFVWSRHPILLDGRSAPLVFKDVLLFHEMARRGNEIPLEPVRPYRDFIVWLRRQDRSGAESFWRRYLAGVSAPTPLPAEHAAQAADGQPVDCQEAERRLTQSMTRELNQLAREHHLTLHTLLLGAWAMVLGRSSGRNDVLFASIAAGRPAELRGGESMVGLFSNAVPVRMRTPQQTVSLEWLAELEQQQAALRQYEHSALADVRAWSDVAPGVPLFQSLFVFEDYPAADWLAPGDGPVQVRDVGVREPANYPLAVSAVPGDRLRLGITYDRKRFDTAAITRVLSDLEDVLRELLAAPLPARTVAAASEAPAQPDWELDAQPRDWPQITPDPANRYEPFPLTQVQQAYWVGRSGLLELGQVATHGYLEIDAYGLDLPRFNRAWQRVLDRHEMLRAVVLQDGLQRVLREAPPYEIEMLDLRGQEPAAVERQLRAIRDRLSQQVLPADRWPMFEVRCTRLDDTRTRLHISSDALFADAWSVTIISRELAIFYMNPETELPPLELSFRDYVLAVNRLQGSDWVRKSERYWRNRLESLPPAPDLPLARDPATLEDVRFVPRAATFDAATWERLRRKAVAAHLTPSVLLMAAFAEVLTAWSKDAWFTVNLTLFNRLPLHPEVDSIVGDFTGLTLLEVNNAKAESFAARAERLQKQLWSDLNHAFVDGVQVQRELARIQGGGPRAGMPVVFTSVLARDEAHVPSVHALGEVVYNVSQTPQVWLDHQVSEVQGSLAVQWDAVDDLFPPGLLDAMFETFVSLVHRLADDEGSWHEPRLDLLPPSQRRAFEAANATAAPPSAELLHTLFAAQVRQRPDQPAVVAADRTLSYRQLDDRCRRVARWLRQNGAARNRLVGVVLEKGWRQAVAVLGILRAGAAYLPIDPDLPEERLRHLLEHGEVELVLTQPTLDRQLPWPEALKRLCVEDDVADEEPGELQEPSVAADDLAYVIYTSGSTGMPKGVMISHAAAVNTIVDMNRRFQVGPADRVLGLSSLSFDLSVYDIFGTLAAGGTLVIPDAAAARDPAHWAELLEREQISVWNSVPALMKLLVEYAGEKPLPSALRLVLLSGDWIPLELPGQIRALAPAAKVVSLGGATEASIWSIFYPIERVDPGWKSIPYGRPLANQSFHVLHESDMQPCPAWVPGQLYIGGVGLAQGYWRDQQRTRASFVVHPATGQRLYRTGDMGRYLPDGTIEFLGREDFQVKVQGYRIELGEIETALVQHAAVQSAVVVARGEPMGEKRLAAYVVRQPEQTVEAGQLRQFLAEKLPGYMIPASLAFLDALPLTSNGKVDRQSLLGGDAKTPDEPPAELPASAGRIARLVGECLHMEHLDPRANLFEIGATSIDLLRVANRLTTELKFRPKIEEFFREPTIEGLARAYDQQLLLGQVSEVAEDTASAAVQESAELLTGLQQREEFRQSQPGLRKLEPQRTQIALPGDAVDQRLSALYRRRRSQRKFSRRPVPLEDLARLLGGLRQISLDGHPKYRYASAGALYPVQTYLHVRPGRVTNLPAGTYYYHPAEHRLMSLILAVDLDPNIHDAWINRSIYESAAFSLFLVAQMKAIEPLYGSQGRHFATLEAGLMSQLLEEAAPDCRLGLCQIGGLDFASIQPLFALDEGHALVHSLLGGPVDADTPTAWSPLHEAYLRAAADQPVDDPPREVAVVRAEPVPAKPPILIALQPKGSRPPLFFVHPVEGTVHAYATLARKLGADQPFYALQARALDEHPPRGRTIAEMAADYLDAIAAVQAEGPYFLGGWSLGGVIAYEMARQLLERGQQVSWLALVDPAPLPATPNEWFDNASWAETILSDPQWRERVASLAAQFGVVPPVPADIDDAQARRWLHGVLQNITALGGYTGRPCPVKAWLFPAQDTDWQDPSDAARAWNALAQGGLEVHPLPGNHHSIMQLPHVEVLARELTRSLQQVFDGNSRKGDQ